MADPLTNAQYAQSLFSALPAMIQRRGEQQATLALHALRRQQQLDDQLATFEQQNERTRRSNEREDSQTKRASEREARRAYAAYATLAADAGETPKPYGSFGKDPEEAVTAISQAMSVLQGKQNDTAFSSTVTGYNRRLQSLKAMTQPTDDDIRGLTQQVLGKMMPTDTKEENWGKALAAIASGSEKVGLELMGPQDRAAFMGARSQGLMALRTLRTKDPAYSTAARELSAIQEAIVGASFKNPKWAKMLGELGKEPETFGAKGGAAGIEDFLNAAGTGNKPTPSPAPAQTVATTQSDPNAYGGLLGLLNRGRRAAGAAVPSFTPPVSDFMKYSLGTGAQLIGGDRLVRDTGLDRADEQILRLRDAYTRRPWIQSTGDAILRSLFRPAPQPGQ